jgi:hypothetical protein
MKNEVDLNLYSLTKIHTKFCLSHPHLFKDEHFSTIQYCNHFVCKNHLNVSIDIYNDLSSLSKENTYLNFGMGPGFLENLSELHGKINLESVEWIDQKENFSIIRQYLEIDNTLTYDCNSVYDEDFKIYNCDKNYDYILLIRFYPLNKKNNTLDQVKNILSKLKKYSDKAIIFDKMSNYKENVLDYFDTINTEETLKRMQASDYRIINL